MSKSTVKPNRINVRRLDASLSTSSRSFQVSRVHSLSLSLVRIEMANLCRGERLESFSLRLVKLANEDSTRFKSSPSRVEATFDVRPFDYYIIILRRKATQLFARFRSGKGFFVIGYFRFAWRIIRRRRFEKVWRGLVIAGTGDRVPLSLNDKRLVRFSQQRLKVSPGGYIFLGAESAATALTQFNSRSMSKFG